MPAPSRQDHSGMRNPPYLTAIMALAASVIVVLSSILSLAFKMSAYNSYMEQTGHGTIQTTVTSSKYGADGFINLYPQDLVPVARAPLILADSLGLATGVAATWLIARFFQIKRVSQLPSWQRTILIAVASANAILAMITMVYVLVQHGRSAHFDPGYAMTTAAYDGGRFSLEAWACESPQYVTGFHAYDLARQCVGEKASRGLAVVLCLFSLAVLAFLVWDLNKAQTVVGKKENAKSQWGDEVWAW